MWDSCIVLMKFMSSRWGLRVYYLYHKYDECWVGVLLEVARTTHTARQAVRQQVGAVLQCLCKRQRCVEPDEGERTAQLTCCRVQLPRLSCLSIAAALLEPISQTSVSLACAHGAAGRQASRSIVYSPSWALGKSCLRAAASRWWLANLLATPRAAAALHDADADDDQVLDGLLVLADAYGTFESALLAAKQSVADAQAGARRGDGTVVAASLRAHRRTEKELHRLAAAMQHASTSRRAAPTPSSADAADTEVVGAVAEAAVAAAEASAVVFSGCAALSPNVSAMVQTASSASHRWLARLGVAPGARKVAPEMAPAALQRLEELEERIVGLESESEKVFRRLLQARVLLLNIHNPL
ncbi:uncharacterized protein [Miscanthus floridulus]|uniref:uncharacterized protein n=1 Tax=Miscanthus floridulus TaxID=154761 RepID=UPI0034584460